MSERTWTLATMVTCIRLAFLPLLWAWALEGRVAWVGLGVMASFLTDILDGQLARRMGQVTRLGSRMDTIADALLEVSCMVWLPWFRPEVLEAPYLAFAVFAIASWVLMAAVGLARFRRFLNLHLWSAKASGVTGSVFVLGAFVWGFHPALFAVALGVFTFANLEGLAVLLTRSQVDEHIGSILRRRAPLSS
jgi:phosphatidylglycerophosphate synthase